MFFINIFLFSIILCNSDSLEKIVNFTISTDRETYRVSENLELKINFSVKENYHIYSSNPDKSPIGGETYIEYYDSLLIKNELNIKEPEPITKFDKNFNQNTSFHKGDFYFLQNLTLVDNITPKSYNIEGTLYATACDPTQCVRIVEDFLFKINVEDGSPRSQYTIENVVYNSELAKETVKC